VERLLLLRTSQALRDNCVEFIMETIKRKGIKWHVLPRRDLIFGFIDKTGDFEPKVKKSAKKYITPKSTVLDIGSNFGSFVIPLAVQFPDTQFIAFEPQLEVFKELIANAELNELNNFKAYNQVLSNKPNIILHAPKVKYSGDDAEYNSGAMCFDTELRERIVEKQGYTKLTPMEMGARDTLIYKSKRLDQYIDEIENVSVIKLDVEGMEKKVLEGAIQIIKRDKPVILFEMWDWYWTGLTEWLDMLNYEVKRINGDDYIACSKEK